MRLLALAATALSGSLLVSGCSSGGDPDAAPAETVTATVTETVTASPEPEATSDPEPTTSGDEPIGVGQTFTSDSVEVTLKQVKTADLSGQGLGGNEQEAFEGLVRTCVPDSGTAYESSVFDFRIVDASGLQVLPTSLISGVQEPAYQTFGTIAPGRCVEGWVQIVGPEGISDSAEVLELTDLTGTVLATWTLA